MTGQGGWEEEEEGNGGDVFHLFTPPSIGRVKDPGATNLTGFPPTGSMLWAIKHC